MMSIEAKIIPLNQNPEPVKLVPANEAKIIPMFPNATGLVEAALRGPQVDSNLVGFLNLCENYPFLAVKRTDGDLTFEITNEADFLQTVKNQKQFGAVNPLLLFLFSQNLNELRLELTVDERVSVVGEPILVQAFEAAIGTHNVHEAFFAESAAADQVASVISFPQNNLRIAA